MLCMNAVIECSYILRSRIIDSICKDMKDERSSYIMVVLIWFYTLIRLSIEDVEKMCEGGKPIMLYCNVMDNHALYSMCVCVI